MITGCQCAGPGYCEKHKLDKTESVFQLCKTDRDTYVRFEIEAGNIKEPGLLEKAVNFTDAISNHILDGLSDVTEEEFDRRISICKSCPLFNPNAESCIICGCSMTLKARWRTGNCPDNPPRW